MSHVPVKDLDAVMTRTRPLWELIRGTRLFVTGGSGFFGGWVLDALARADDELDLGIRVTVLTRDAGQFTDRLPHLSNHRAIDLVQGDVREVTAPAFAIDYILHMAAEPHGPNYAADPDGAADVIVSGTRRMLEIARQCEVRRLLLISSGAIYGDQPDREHISEEAPPGDEPDAARRVYAEGKRTAEQLAGESGLPVVVARPFAFVGPRLPLDAGFAVGKFIAAAVRKQPIRVAHGAAVRSYLYASDLAVWLWTILLRGAPGRAYNVGSEQPIALTALAMMIAGMFRPPPEVERAAEVHGGRRYVPSTHRARTELGLAETVPLPEAVRRTVHWHCEVANASPGR